MDTRHTPHVVRSTRLDAYRGIAVIFMIIAHGLFFFHNRTNFVLTGIEELLNRTVFLSFIFISGMALSRWLDDHAHLSFRGTASYILKRVGILFTGYLITALVSLATSVKGNVTVEFIRQIPMTLSMLTPPSFTEYLPLFILITLSLIFLRPLYRWTRLSLLLTMCISALSYSAGILLYPVTLPPVFHELKLLFAGGGTELRFPVLYYFPVYLLGLWWQHHMDHARHTKQNLLAHMYVLAGLIAFSLASVVFLQSYVFELLNPVVRWPPSLTFLTTGTALTIVLLMATPSLRVLGTGPRNIAVYFGRDALDLWVTHLVFLFVYARFVNFQAGDSLIVAALLVLLIALSAGTSSFTILNATKFPTQFSFGGQFRFRKRYLLLLSVFGAMLAWIIQGPTAPRSTYGNILLTQPLAVEKRIPDTSNILVTTDRSWYSKKDPQTTSIKIQVNINDQGNPLDVNPDFVVLQVGKSVEKFSPISTSSGAMHYSVPIQTLATGTYPIRAEVINGKSSIVSNIKNIHVTEPLLVAWTLDWEGWDATPSALTTIQTLPQQYPTLTFTHYVSPRTFVDGVLTPERRAEIIQFLQDRVFLGEEIAMHLHMHFDIVRAAGITPRTSLPWGMRTSEGYDVPTSEYTPEELGTIIQYAKGLYDTTGLPQLTGYRAGGWFLTTEQLKVIEELGFLYDSSGRDKPATGAFAKTPWSLPYAAQPYYPSLADQNAASVIKTGILEIPTSGLTTFESSPTDMIARFNYLFKGTALPRPKALVYVSHPQFYEKEFPKIPKVLSEISSHTLANDQGPVIFVTTREIYQFWKEHNL